MLFFATIQVHIIGRVSTFTDCKCESNIRRTCCAGHFQEKEKLFGLIFIVVPVNSSVSAQQLHLPSLARSSKLSFSGKMCVLLRRKIERKLEMKI